MNKICVPGFDISGGLPIMAMHTFSILSNGNLLHEIDGKVRAEVPPEGFEGYAESWPDCVAVLSQRVFELAKLTALQDNIDSGSPASSEEVPPSSPVA